MTSKNILWLGSLLLLLLTTTCIAYFLDKYNPVIQHVDYNQSTHNTVEIRTDDTDVYAQDVEIDEFIGQNIQKNFQKVDESIQKHPAQSPKNTITSKKVPAEINNTEKPVFVAAKIDTSIIPKKQKKPFPPHKRKTPIVHKKAHITAHPGKSKRIQIEPVITSKTLYIPENGSLRSSDIALLKNILKQAKEYPKAALTLESKTLTSRKKNYLRSLRKYLIRHGLKSTQIHVRIKNQKSPITIEDTNNVVDLSLIQRL